MMSDRLTRQFRVQLTTAMDSVLRTAVFEAIRIFENVLYEYQMELAQKGEEATQLKIKLQRAELQLKELKDHRFEHCREAERNQTRKEPVIVVDVPTQTSEVPEIDFEVPGDWCAPLGSEVVIKQEDAVCPSVRLRQFSIPLRHIPVEHKVADDDINLQRTSGRRRSKRISILNKKSKHSQDRQLPVFGQGNQHPPVRNGVKVLLHGSQCPPVTSDVKILLRDLKQEYPDLIGLEDHERRKRRNNLEEKGYDSAAKLIKGQRKSKTTNASSAEPERGEDHHEKQYFCRYCRKVFERKLSRDMHARFHNRCRGCKKRFRLRADLLYHKHSCGKLKKLLAREEAKSQKTPRKAGIPPKIRVMTMGAHASGKNSRILPVKLSRAHHNYNFDLSRLRKRMETCEIVEPFHCSLCPKKFRASQALSVHMEENHKNHMNTTDENGDLGWTEPLEDIEDNEKDVTLPIRNANHNQDSASPNQD